MDKVNQKRTVAAAGRRTVLALLVTCRFRLPQPSPFHVLSSLLLTTLSSLYYSSNPIMPPRASNERLDFTPILTHYLFLFTTVFAVVSILLSYTRLPLSPSLLF